MDVGSGDNHGLVVNLGGMLIEGTGGLGAEVAILEVEVKRADPVWAADAGELRASLDPLGSVASHKLDCKSHAERERSTVVAWRR